LHAALAEGLRDLIRRDKDEKAASETERETEAPEEKAKEEKTAESGTSSEGAAGEDLSEKRSSEKDSSEEEKQEQKAVSDSADTGRQSVFPQGAPRNTSQLPRIIGQNESG